MASLPTPAQARERAAQLSPYLSARLGRSVTVTSVSLASDGMSALTMILGLSGDEEIVIRMRAGLAPPTDAGSIEEHQFEVLAAARAVGVEAPEPLLYELDPSILGGPFLVTRRLPGSPVTPWARAGRDRLLEMGRGQAGTQLLQILADIHKAPIPPHMRKAAADPKAATLAGLRELRALVDTFAAGPEPILIDALGFLANAMPEVEEAVLVHGDYRAGNFLFEGDRISGVLDWELSHVGDPAEDLAWLMGKANRASRDLACDMVPLDAVIGAYEEASGRTIAAASVAYWDVFLLARTTSYWLLTSDSWRRGDLEDVRTARWTYNLPKLRSMILDSLERADP